MNILTAKKINCKLCAAAEILQITTKEDFAPVLQIKMASDTINITVIVIEGFNTRGGETESKFMDKKFGQLSVGLLYRALAFKAIVY